MFLLKQLDWTSLDLDDCRCITRISMITNDFEDIIWQNFMTKPIRPIKQWRNRQGPQCPQIFFTVKFLMTNLEKRG